MAFVTVQGAVGRTFFEGKGAEIIESWKGREGQDMSKRWSAFFEEPHGLAQGDQVKVSGMHSDKVDEWEKDGQTRHTVKRAINRARLEGDRGASEPAEEPWATTPPGGSTAETGDVWNQPVVDAFGDSTPF